MRINIRSGWILMAGVALAMVACARSTPEDPIEAHKREQAEKMLQRQQKEDPFQRSQTDIELAGRWVGAGVVSVRLKNRTVRTLDIGPENFRIILPPVHDLIKTEPGSRKTFPIIAIKSGELASGELQFPPQEAGKEARLVFFHPDCKPAMARIE